MKTVNVDLTWGASTDNNPMRLKGTIQIDEARPAKSAESEGADIEAERKSQEEAQARARREVIKGEFANAVFERVRRGDLV